MTEIPDSNKNLCEGLSRNLRMHPFEFFENLKKGPFRQNFKPMALLFDSVLELQKLKYADFRQNSKPMTLPFGQYRILFQLWIGCLVEKS